MAPDAPKLTQIPVDRSIEIGDRGDEINWPRLAVDPHSEQVFNGEQVMARSPVPSWEPGMGNEALAYSASIR